MTNVAAISKYFVLNSVSLNNGDLFKFCYNNYLTTLILINELNYMLIHKLYVRLIKISQKQKATLPWSLWKRKQEESTRDMIFGILEYRLRFPKLHLFLYLTHTAFEV
jgi:hypothetical protein